MSVQYRLAIAKKDERVDGPDGADVVFTSTIDVVTASGFDATVEFMRGRVKATVVELPFLDLPRKRE